MELKRDIMERLLRWKNSEYRKPLIIQGRATAGNSNGKNH